MSKYQFQKGVSSDTPPDIVETIRPRGHANALWFTLASFSLLLLFSWALFQAAWVRDPRWLAVSFASSGGLAMLIDRKRQHDKLSVVRRIPIPQKLEVPKPEVRPVTQIQKRNTIKYGTFSLSRDNWQRLGEAIANNNGRFIRDIVPSNIFPSLSRNWNKILAEFRRLGWVGDDQYLTAAGVEWFAGFTPTLLLQSASSHDTGRPTTTRRVTT